MDDFNKRLEQRRVILGKIGAPELWFWNSAFEDVLSWLAEHYPPGSTVLELGCGLGFFLHALRDHGYQAVGLDVAKTAVELNRKDGFQVWHGPIETMPPDWVQPDAVVSFFMVHHLEDPMSFLECIRERAPSARLALAAYGPTNKGDPASFPPRTLVRWNSKALGVALERTGYRARVVDIASTGAERGLLAWLRESLAGTNRLPKLYQMGKRFESMILSRMPQNARTESYVILGFGEPQATTPVTVSTATEDDEKQH